MKGKHVGHAVMSYNPNQLSPVRFVGTLSSSTCKGIVAYAGKFGGIFDVSAWGVDREGNVTTEVQKDGVWVDKSVGAKDTLPVALKR